MNLSELIEARSLVVCCGSGGVGKTTAAAAIALEGARRGRKVLVLTIDPARRLANSLGVEELNNVERRVDPARLEAAGIDVQGELHALMLDPKATFDELIKRLAGDGARAKVILENTVYHQLTSALAGTLEYMAVEKLYELHGKGVYDLIVLDTPPTKNALDFLDAPGKLSNFLDERVIKWFIPEQDEDGTLRYKVVQKTGKLVWSVLGRVFGDASLDEIGTFFASISGMTGAFRLRAVEIEKLLASSETSFIVVTSGDPTVIDDAMYFYRKIREHRMPFGGFVVNRLSPDTGPIEHGLVAADLGTLPENLREGPEVENLLRKMEEGYTILRKASAIEGRTIERLRTSTGFQGFIARVPQFAHDIFDIPGLVLINRYLFGEGDLLAREA
ncbi:MAG: ArsA family ATPase [Deltaproteobacteria bacterium]|nr:ArsA family ATPase [Deltaproteobacteria bacterium]